jgi:hypothetical protein
VVRLHDFSANSHSSPAKERCLLVSEAFTKTTTPFPLEEYLGFEWGVGSPGVGSEEAGDK